LSEEGCFDKGVKANFLAKLSKRTEHDGKAVALTKEPLGEVTKAEVDAIASKLKYSQNRFKC